MYDGVHGAQAIQSRSARGYEWIWKYNDKIYTHTDTSEVLHNNWACLLNECTSLKHGTHSDGQSLVGTRVQHSSDGDGLRFWASLVVTTHWKHTLVNDSDDCDWWLLCKESEQEIIVCYDMNWWCIVITEGCDGDNYEVWCLTLLLYGCGCHGNIWCGAVVDSNGDEVDGRNWWYVVVVETVDCMFVFVFL